MLRTLVILSFLLVTRLSAQPVFFESLFGSAEYDYARSLKQISSGSIFVAGYTYNGPFGGVDAALHKLDRFGNLVWTKYYGDSLDDLGLFLTLSSDGNLLLCGEKQTSSSGLDAFLAKIDTTGNELWFRTYGGPLNQSAKFVTEAANGDFLLAGFANAGSSNDSYLLRTDSAGNELWNQLYGGSDNDYADAVRELPGGDLILTGDTRSWGFGGYDVELIRTDSAGNVAWDFTYGDSLQNGCQGILVTGDMRLVSFGETEIAPFSLFDFYLEKIDTAGNSQWRRTFGGASSDAAFSATEVSDGFMLCGYSNSYAPGPISVVVMKTDTGGNLLWAHPYGGTGIDIGYEIIPSLDNGFLVIGTSNVSGDDQCYLLHTDAGGWTGMREDAAKRNAVSIFPNPSDGLFSLGFDGPRTGATLSVFSMPGKLLVQVPAENTIDLRGKLVPGIYLLDITANGEHRVARLVIGSF
ncbi:MAG: hypothetical protein FD123_269 [Bacteroidetes bacterium]|nr:MAG: hypothetical protein FD123_269 [Bacteroidota bacterium]